jgi:hypothetical protein
MIADGKSGENMQHDASLLVQVINEIDMVAACG